MFANIYKLFNIKMFTYGMRCNIETLKKKPKNILLTEWETLYMKECQRITIYFDIDIYEYKDDKSNRKITILIIL